MGAERWGEVDALFAEALELAPEDRAAFLEGACRADPELRGIVEALLAADEKARTFLERPAMLEADGEEEGLAAGQSLGPYRLERLISRGGMGTVYVASRDDGQFERRVAVKLLYRGATDPQALQRFRAERQILARLEHPSIARLYDGGESEHGIPFLVMEFVEGLPLDVYCDRQRLGIDARLRLCQRLFEAVTYAHQNLLVHRDIKPSNVLVTRQGELKLLDFGIAEQLVDHEGGEAWTSGVRAMTPGYASPEQVRGEAITTASDVYALGVVIYELLCGRRPHGPAEGASPGSDGAIPGSRPERPSRTLGRPSSLDEEQRRRAICDARRARPRGLRRKLRGDLDAIVIRALEEDPKRRYPSVSDLAADVDRHLRIQPVSARSRTPAYLVGRFLRRRRGGVALGGTAFASILALLVGLHQQRDRASRERDKAREALAFLVGTFEQADPFRRSAENISASDLLQAGAVRLRREPSRDPEVRGALLSAIGQAEVGLRQLSEAEPLLEGALALRREHAPDSLELAESLEQLAWLRFLSSQYDAAEALYREALELRMRLAGRDSPQVARTLNSLGTVLGERLQSTDARRSQEIEGLHREALRIFREAEGPDSLDVAYTLFRLAKLMKDRGELAQAEQLSRENVRINVLRHGEAHFETAMALRLLALILIDRGELDEAQALLVRALAAQRQSLPEGHPDILLSLNDLALVHDRKGELAEAEARFREALEGYLAAYGEVHAHTAVVMSNLANVILDRGRAEEAAALQQRALAIKIEVFGKRHVFVADSLNSLARADAILGRQDEALELAERSLAITRDVVGPAHPAFAKSLAAVGLVLHRRGESAAAEPYLRQSLELFRQTLPRSDTRTARAEVLLGSCLSALGRDLEAGPLLRRGYETLAARFAADHPYVREAREALASHRRTELDPPGDS